MDRPSPKPRPQVWLGGHWFTVVGILAPAPLAEELDTAALIGWPVAQQLLGSDGYATTVYTRGRGAPQASRRSRVRAAVQLNAGEPMPAPVSGSKYS